MWFQTLVNSLMPRDPYISMNWVTITSNNGMCCIRYQISTLTNIEMLLFGLCGDMPIFITYLSPWDKIVFPCVDRSLMFMGANTKQRDTRCKDPLQWRHNGCDAVSNHQPYNCLLNSLFKRRSKKTSELRVIGLCEFPAQMASNAENVSIWWRHHGKLRCMQMPSKQKAAAKRNI